MMTDYYKKYAWDRWFGMHGLFSLDFYSYFFQKDRIFLPCVCKKN